MKIAVLGPAGTYSEEAGMKYNKKAEFIYTDFVSEVFGLVGKGEVDVGIVPVENQLAGTVGETLDGLYRNPLFVVGEIVVEIKHVLAAQNDDYEVIISHPQALNQCNDFVVTTGRKTEKTGSTAGAMEKASKDDRYAAIGTELAAKSYGLKIIARGIQGDDGNCTRFFVIARDQKLQEEGANKTSIAIYYKEDRPGLLFDILKVFKEGNINLTKIESRPSKKELGEYIFYIDFEGSIEDDIIKDAFEKLERQGNVLRIFGSYKRRY